MLKNLFNKKSSISNRDTMIQSFEGIGDILVFETKRQKNDIVSDGLQKIRDSIKTIFEMQKNSPEKFDQLVASPDLVELQKKDEEGANFQLEFNPQKYLVGFLTPINQIMRVYEAAINSQNGTISKRAVYQLNWILAELSSRENNGLFVELILQKLSEITRIAVQHSDNSVHAAAIHWYTDTVFNQLSRIENFQLSYLPLFDKYFFSTVKYIIKEEQTSIFRSLVSSLVDGIQIPHHHEGKVWDYVQIFQDDPQKYSKLSVKHGLEKKISGLSLLSHDLHTREKMEAWLEKFVELKKIFEPTMTDEQRKLAQKTEIIIREMATLQFKYQNLLEISFAIGAYCLFKKKYGYVKYLWEYKQPSDSDGTWGGNDIVPDTLDKAIRFYLRKELYNIKFEFLEDHHGSGKYYNEYFLLLLARILQTTLRKIKGDYAEIKNFQLPDLSVHRLNEFINSTAGFVALSEKLTREINMLSELGFLTETLNEIFNEALMKLLNKVKKEAENQISTKHKRGKMSLKKIRKFKNKSIKSFYEEASFRDIFANYFNAYEKNINEKTKTDRVGINQVSDKSALFDEWHVSYYDWGNSYGKSIALYENSYLLRRIAENCQKLSDDDIESALSKIQNTGDIAIFAINIQPWGFFKSSKRFVPKWQKDTKKPAVKKFRGWYEFNGKSIPVFDTYLPEINQQIMILNKSKVGRIIQFSPLEEGEKETSVKDIFYMDIQAFSENKELTETLIKQSPGWLKEEGNAQQQRDYLQKSVLIQIHERFEYEPPEEFQGYILFPKEN